ncbi:uncharacterized protein LOC143914279 [Arctopsyche grandis]|uniref:uncharacterized protein LOC143914279 n=1 Tax=Arctopsyche grandis TaxID=121162 RepID=UPI00406D86C5
MTAMSATTLDFSRVCRVCCNEGPTLPLFRVNLHRKVMACAAVQVWQNDGLPGQICKKCAARLHVSFQFKRLCEKSDVHLRRCRDSGKYIDSKKMKEISNQHDVSGLIDVKLSEESLIESNQSTSSMSLSGDCNFVNCAIQPLTDNRDYDSIQNIITSVEDGHLEQQSLYHNNDILVAVGAVDLPMRDQFDLSSSFTNQSLGNLTLDNAFTNQVINQPHSVADQILTLETLTIPNSLQPQKLGVQVFELTQMDVTSMTEDDKDVIHSQPDMNKQNGKIQIENENDDLIHCPICNKGFNSTSKLNRHTRTHSDEILYRCDICNKGFIHGGNFKVHLRMHTDERPFSCTVCHKRCRQQQDLDKHMRTHTGERPHVCSVCERAFTTSSNLVAHERIHRGEKPYICTVCQKAFCQSNELTKHVRTHTGEKSHECPVCKKGFNGSSTLIVHMRIHTGERPYVCIVCNKGFTQSSCLAVHTRKHAGKNEFSCARCPRTFGTEGELQLHTAAHPPAIHACTEPGCVRLFSRSNDLLRHMKLTHHKQFHN